MMIDNGTSQASFAANEYTFWKFRYAEKALNFWVERGDFKYNVSQHLEGPQFHVLDQVVILGGSSVDPQIKDSIGHYAACSLGLTLDPEPVAIAYDAVRDTINLTTKAGGR